MKYITLVLLLLLGALARTPGASLPASLYRADARFQVNDKTGVSTDLTVVVQKLDGVVEVRISILQTSPACIRDPRACPVGAISANTIVRAHAGDFEAAPDLSWATLHTTIAVSDDLTHHQQAVRIDLAWSATGGASWYDDGQPTELAQASAQGIVATAAATYLNGDSSWSGAIARS